MRQLKDLVSVGPATLEDFTLLGISAVEELKDQDATELYQRLCRITGIKMDICCEDVFRAAIEQARDPNLDLEKCQWWYWSALRKSKGAKKLSPSGR
ncbi:MAG: helix-hairpin-helix domain-containing protein [Candidatus Obscuribacterales bacterium]|jgi:hypothetical protein|nr:helix-hairpin-helix domain-containing protein [Candidatus Obscuribacterales bacterium]